MTDTSESAGRRKGCGPVLVLMIATLSLTFGLIAGAGGLYAYLNQSDDALHRVGLAPPAAADTTGETADPDELYALAYPLLETLNVPDSIDESEMRTYLHENRSILQECYMEELQRSPNTRGELDLQFSVSGSSGDVTAAVTRGNHTGSEELSDCVLNNIRQHWSFSPPDTSGVATVRFHALFLPLGAEGV